MICRMQGYGDLRPLRSRNGEERGEGWEGVEGIASSMLRRNINMLHTHTYNISLFHIFIWLSADSGDSSIRPTVRLAWLWVDLVKYRGVGRVKYRGVGLPVVVLLIALSSIPNNTVAIKSMPIRVVDVLMCGTFSHTFSLSSVQMCLSKALLSNTAFAVVFREIENGRYSIFFLELHAFLEYAVALISHNTAFTETPGFCP